MYAVLSLLLCSVHTYEYSLQRCTHKHETNTLSLLHTLPTYRVTLAVAQQMVRLLPSSRLHSLAATAGSCVTAPSKSRAHGAIHTASCCTMHGSQAVNPATGALTFYSTNGLVLQLDTHCPGLTPTQIVHFSLNM